MVITTQSGWPEEGPLSARELLGSIDADHLAVARAGAMRGGTMFRGVLANQDLKPSIDRMGCESEVKFRYVGTTTGHMAEACRTSAGLSAHEKIRLLENNLALFYSSEVRHGRALPRLEAELHDAFVNVKDRYQIGIEKHFDDPEFLQFLALAQHYGIPTPLLDWTDDPYVALYFACLSGIKKILSSDVKDKSELDSLPGIALWSCSEMFCHYTCMPVATVIPPKNHGAEK